MLTCCDHQPIDLVAISEKARRVTADSKRSSGPQSRNRWSEEDVKTLLLAISREGPSWTRIYHAAQDGVYVFERSIGSQTGSTLRDKARQIKESLIK